ncbi:MAG: ankyrin repeat domain-containing protein [Spirochaetales bacterium]|nr:ankyrin repeat domain-containing protein [Spirochaetales bacterium]
MKKAMYITGILCLVLMSCNEPENTGTQLFKAIYDSDIDKVKELVNQGIDVNEYTSEHGDSALTYAILTGTNDMVNLLLDNDAKPGPSRPGDHWSDMSIPMAITLNQMDMVKTLITRGVGVNAESIRDATLLIYTSCKGYTELVQALIDSGQVDINHRGGYLKQTALERAKAEGHDDIVKLLIDAGAEE